MKKFLLRTHPNLSPLLKLAIPLIFTGAAQSSAYFFETLFLAHLGKQILAAGALVSWLFATLTMILYGTLSAINILVAYKYGAKDEPGIAAVFRDGLLFSSTFFLFLLSFFVGT